MLDYTLVYIWRAYRMVGSMQEYEFIGVCGWK